MTQETRRRQAERERLAAQHPEIATAVPDDLEVPRFSQGQETEPDDQDKRHVGRYSDGLETEPPEAAGKEHIGRFDEGQDTAGDLVDNLHVGRFSEGLDAHSRPGAPPERR